jgi:hypothetical protein
MKRALAILTAGIIAAVSTTMLLTATTSAIQFSETNKDIEILYGEFTGYRFSGPEAPIGEVETADIAYVKFYIKCPDLETIEDAIVDLVFNSGTTSWVEEEHDLNDGLIVEIAVPGVVTGDFFDAALGTWSEEVTGTFSVELLNADKEVISESVYGGAASTPEETTAAVTTQEPPKDGTAAEETTAGEPVETTAYTGTEAPPKDGTATTVAGTEPPPKDGTYAATTVTAEATTMNTVAGAQETEATDVTTSDEPTEPAVTTTPAVTAPTDNVNPPTGNSALITLTIATAISGLAIATTKKRK